MDNSNWNPLESLTLKGEEETIKTGDAIELAYAFAIYRGARVRDLNSKMDCQLSEVAARRLRRTQNEVGIFLEEEEKLLACERRMVRFARTFED